MTSELHDQNFKNLFLDFPKEALALFEKYSGIIDEWAGVRPEDRDLIRREIQKHKETAMIAQWLKEEGRKEGHTLLLSRQLAQKYYLAPDNVAALLEGVRSEDLIELGEYMLDCESFDDIQQWVQQRKQGNLS